MADAASRQLPIGAGGAPPGPRALVVLDVVGLTPRHLAGMPRLSALARSGSKARLRTVFPALTCPVQATLLTGLSPSSHGIVGNGWFFRDHQEVLFWRQGHGLVEGERLWEALRREFPGARVANLCWWYALGASTDLVVTPRPVYHADGRKSPDCYAWPPGLYDELTRDLGRFPLFRYWGPLAGRASSEWIGAAAVTVLERHRPDLTLVYLPHLDYDLQRFGPGSPEARRSAAEVDAVAGGVLDAARRAGAAVVVLSEYGITEARRPVDLNRHLRRAGLLQVHVQLGMEYLDPWSSEAFAVADHQVAHVYVRSPGRVPEVRALLAGVGGVAEVIDGDGLARAGLAHARSGELVAVAEPAAWFTYYYWLDDRRAPDFARTVEIHRKPGYDPAELFFDPADRLVKAKAAMTLVRRRLGLRAVASVVSLDPSMVRGTHGRPPAADADHPLLLCSERGVVGDELDATQVKGLLLDLMGASGVSEPPEPPGSSQPAPPA